MEYLATFPNQMQAVEYARALSARGIPHRLMPRPRTLEASCGTAVRFSSRLPAEALRLSRDGALLTALLTENGRETELRLLLHDGEASA